MINLIIKNIFENSNKIDSIAKYINNTNKKTCLQFLLVAISMCAITSVVKAHEEKINDLEEELERIKSDLT